jgi:hypothetical protein
MTEIKILHETFTSQLPELEVMARAWFRGLRREAQDEAIQNTTALAWKYWLRLAEQGRDNEPGLLRNVWWFAIKQTRVGRTITRGDGQRGRGKQDVYDRPHGVTVEHDTLNFLIGQTTAIPDAVVFRLDIPAFLATLTERQRTMALDLGSGMTTNEVARKHGVTQGAVSQSRNRFKKLLDQFYADAA